MTEVRVAGHRSGADALEDGAVALSPEPRLRFPISLEHPGRIAERLCGEAGPVVRRRTDEDGRLMPFVRERPGA